MKKKVSTRGKRNRLLVLALIILIIGFGTSRLWQRVKGKEVTPTKTTQTTTEVSETSAQLKVPLINQLDEPSLFNGCEITSLAMMLNYAGIDVSKNELAEAIPVVDYLDADGNYGDPNQGFVGDIYGIEIGYIYIVLNNQTYSSIG